MQRAIRLTTRKAATFVRPRDGHSSYQRFFRATVQASSVRRRRPNRSRLEKHVSPTTPQAEARSDFMMSPTEFNEKASTLLSKLKDALEPLVPLNETMILSRGNNVDEPDDTEEALEEGSVPRGEYLLIDLGPVHGQYNIQVDEEQQLLVFVSPVSGQRVYKFHHDDWICTEDGHNFEGLFVRDLIRQIQGVPQL